jgi:hypothetical protein
MHGQHELHILASNLSIRNTRVRAARTRGGFLRATSCRLDDILAT